MENNVKLIEKEDPITGTAPAIFKAELEEPTEEDKKELENKKAVNSLLTQINRNKVKSFDLIANLETVKAEINKKLDEYLKGMLLYAQSKELEKQLMGTQKDIIDLSKELQRYNS